MQRWSENSHIPRWPKRSFLPLTAADCCWAIVMMTMMMRCDHCDERERRGDLTLGRGDVGQIHIHCFGRTEVRGIWICDCVAGKRRRPNLQQPGEDRKLEKNTGECWAKWSLLFFPGFHPFSNYNFLLYFVMFIAPSAAERDWPSLPFLPLLFFFLPPTRSHPKAQTQPPSTSMGWSPRK